MIPYLKDNFLDRRTYYLYIESTNLRYLPGSLTMLVCRVLYMIVINR